MKTIDWSTYKFRASQIGKIMTGSLPTKGEYKARIEELENERDTLTNINGRKVKWTENKQLELDKLIEKENTPLFELLPKTMTTELRKLYRSEKHNRNFSFTNKYVQKGIAQEDEAISVYKTYLGKSLMLNNKIRLENDYVSGEPDLTDTNDVNNCNEGYDTKASWELDTFPFPEDKLDSDYEYQNQTYMWLTKTNKWTTVYVLVNTTEDLLHKEKMKWYYALGSPEEHLEEEYERYLEYENKCKELEVRLIFDYNKFVKSNPNHQMFIDKIEWFEKGYDISLDHRVIEKVSHYDQYKIDDIKERIEISREYLQYLDGKINKKWI